MSFIFQGGFVMYILMAISILSVAVIINRIRFYRSIKIRSEVFLSDILKYLKAGSPEAAISKCEEKDAPLTSVVKSGLLHWEEGPQAMEEAFQSAELREIPRLEKNLTLLSTIASVATLLGFTGTVTGMIGAFNSIAQEGASSPAVVAAGISEALLTTAAGLLIAVPTVIFVRYFESMVDKFVNEIDIATHEIVRLSKGVK